jgi:hypothetical protein
MNSRYLLYEAQQAFYYGLEAGQALSAVTATPAEILGLGQRVGYVKEGWDAGEYHTLTTMLKSLCYLLVAARPRRMGQSSAVVGCNS